jgi:hypothetical protein
MRILPFLNTLTPDRRPSMVNEEQYQARVGADANGRLSSKLDEILVAIVRKGLRQGSWKESQLPLK